MAHEHIGHYPLLERIDRGTSGRIYLAKQLTMDREVVLKVLPTELASDEEYGERFLREARLAAALNHPNIITIIDFGRDAGRPFYVMEFVDGIELQRLVVRDGPVETRRALNWFISMAKALEHAHERGVIHHEVKPENMLLREDGHLLLSDFGIARTAGPGGRREADPPLTTDVVVI